MYGLLLMYNWILLSESMSYGVETFLDAYGPPPYIDIYYKDLYRSFAYDYIIGIRVNLPSRPITKDGYLLAWVYHSRIPLTSSCATNTYILRNIGNEWHTIYSGFLSSKPDQRIRIQDYAQSSGVLTNKPAQINQAVKDKLVVIKKGDILSIEYTYRDECREPKMSLTFHQSKAKKMPEKNFMFVEEGVNMALNILVSEFRILKDIPRIHYLASDGVRIQWDTVQASNFTHFRYHVRLFASFGYLVTNRTVYENSAVFNDLSIDMVYYATVQIVQQIHQWEAVDPIYVTSPLFCAERRKIEDCLLLLREIEKRPNSQRKLELRYPEVDTCVTHWNILYGVPSQGPQMVSSLAAALNESIKFDINTELVYRIAIYTNSPYNRTREICSVGFKYPDSTTLRAKMTCFNNLILSWDVTNDHLQQSVAFLVKCLSDGNTLLNLETSQNSVRISNCLLGVEYKCTIQAKLFSNIYSNPANLTVMLGIKKLGIITIASETSGYAVLYFNESDPPYGSMIAEDVVYKIFCEPYYFAEGRYSPLILNDVLEEKEYNCRMTPTDKCGRAGPASTFSFSTVRAKIHRKLNIAWIVVPIASSFLLVSALVGCIYFGHPRTAKVSDNNQLQNLGTGFSHSVSNEYMFRSSAHSHQASDMDMSNCSDLELAASSINSQLEVPKDLASEKGDVFVRKKTRKRRMKKIRHKELQVEEAL